MQNKNEILIEGKKYSFLINKKVKLPTVGQEAFILTGPYGKKYLLNSVYYTHYHLRIGQTINCHVDKINCSGQIFLEPDHPHYSIGKDYDFLVTRLDSNTDAWGNEVSTAWVIDLHGKDWPCVIDNNTKLIPKTSILTCNVHKIKKARLFLAQKSMIDAKIHLRIGEYYLFKLVKEIDHINKYYYVLEDSEGQYHMILKELYADFNFIIGQNIRCKVMALNNDGSYKIEPDNPFYKIGEQYYFKFLRMELHSNSYEKQTDKIWLEDRYGKETKVWVHEWQKKKSSYNPDKILCRVISFKKGKLQLKNIEQNPDIK